MSATTDLLLDKIRNDYADLLDESFTTTFTDDAMYVMSASIIHIAETMEYIAKTLGNIDKQLQTNMARAWREGYDAHTPAGMVGPDHLGAYHAPTNPYDNSQPEES
ncbi:hypothetical protein [Bifidobacterium vansinderenii]|uniref:Uncharacterized protein n=1 Tax=Bifidobacterium vansinderenii TaxID=1984871 RepID=A0A229VWB0_9BIFI|nr:hypothetical protein [Bifidobacterium vansinderenii]OXM99896.1 hypothetical protein Tam10B_1859 [Bifidobacterium vansinderenii]